MAKALETPAVVLTRVFDEFSRVQDAPHSGLAEGGAGVVKFPGCVDCVDHHPGAVLTEGCGDSAVRRDEDARPQAVVA